MADHDFFFDDPATETTVWNTVRRNSERQAQLQSQVTPEQATNLAGLAETYPTFSNELLTGLTVTGVNWNHPALVELAQREERERTGFLNSVTNKLDDWIVDPFEATTRTAFTAFDSVWEEVAARPFRTVVGTIQGRNPLDAYAEAGESFGIKAIRNLVRGERVNLGSGFFPNSTEPTERPEFAQRVLAGQNPQQALRDVTDEFGAPITRIANEQQRQITFRGQPVSFGRVAAGVVLEPGSQPYNILSGAVDAAAQIFLDPAIAVGSTVTAARNSRRVFGLIDDAARPSILRPLTVQNFLGGDDGKRLADWITQQSGDEGFLAIRNLLQKPGKPTLPRQLLNDLTDAAAPDQVINILGDHLGITIRETPFAGPISRAVGGLIDDAGSIGGFRTAARVVGSERNPFLLRMFSDMPGGHINLDNMDEAVGTLDEFLISMEFDAATRGRHLRDFARLGNNDRSGAYAVMSRVGDDVTDQLVATGLDSLVAQEAGRFFKTTLEDIDKGRNYWANLTGNMPFPGAKTKILNGGRIEVMPSPIQISEYLQRNIPLPDPREMRRALSRLSNTTKKGHLEGGALTAAMDNVMSRFWKPAVLLRGAWPVRVVGEEQFRIAASGLDSFVNHPLRAIQLAINKPLLGIKPTFTNGVAGTWDNMLAFEAAQSHKLGGVLGRSVTSGLDIPWQPIARTNQTYNRWWGKYLQRLRSDPTLRAALDDVDAAADAFVANTTLRAKLGNTPEKAVLVNSDEAARQYVRAIYARAHEATGGRIGIIDTRTDTLIWETGQDIGKLTEDQLRHMTYEVLDEGSPTLLDALRTGDLNGVKLTDPTAGRRLTRELELFDGPQYVPGQHMVSHRVSAKKWDEGIDAMFAALGGRPTNYLSRSPAFKQLYWQRVAELVPFMDDTTRAAMLAQARAANLPTRLLDDMVERASVPVRTKGRVITDLDEVDVIAQAHGLHETKRLLYDLNRRHQWTDITRNIFPFAEAWSEIITTWARLLRDRPIEITRRLQQTVEGARESDEVFNDQGFFYENANGDEVFAYPGSGLIADWMFGADAAAGLRLEGSVSSLNLFTQSFLPGFGPIVQIPTANLLSERPVVGPLLEQFGVPTPLDIVGPDLASDINKIVSPFGQSTEPLTSPGGLLDRALIPAWFRRMLIGINQDAGPWDRLYGNTVIDLYKGQLLSGELADVTPEIQAASLQRAKKSATQLSVLRGVIQFFAPASPQIAYDVEDKSGKVWGLQVLANELRNQLEANDWDTATVYAQFIKDYGVDPFLLMEPKSEQIRRTSVTAEGLAFQRRNAELFEEFPNTAYYAQPDDTVDDFDYEAYIESINRGDRVPRTPEQWQAAANHALGSWQYQVAKDGLTDPDSEQSKAYLRALRSWLIDRYPGYDPGNQLRDFGSVEQPSRQAKINELYKWRDNEFLRGTNAGRGLMVYLDARDEAMAAAEQLGLVATSFATAKRATHLREYLRATAEWIVRQPDMNEFATMWAFILERELTEDETVPEVPAA